MLTLIIALVGMLLDSLILYRAFLAKLFAKYPFFYGYIAWVLLVEIIRAPVYHLGSPAFFRNFYWTTEFLCLVVGYGVILEVIRKALEPYAGAERFARIGVLTVFAAVFSFVAFQIFTHPSWSPATCYGELARDLRAVQVMVLASVLTIVSYYRITLGKNLKGIILGYGFVIAYSVVTPALRSYFGPSFEGFYRLVPSYLFFVSQAIWAAALWNYSPNPAPEMPSRLESDYESLALRTRGLLGEMRSHIGRTVRP
jgi:hypothetical protein